jgi:hypothetical protein
MAADPLCVGSAAIAGGFVGDTCGNKMNEGLEAEKENQALHAWLNYESDRSRARTVEVQEMTRHGGTRKKKKKKKKKTKKKRKKRRKKKSKKKSRKSAKEDNSVEEFLKNFRKYDGDISKLKKIYKK